MKTGFTEVDVTFMAELEREIEISVAKIEKYLTDAKSELDTLIASLAAEPLPEVEPLDIDFDW